MQRRSVRAHLFVMLVAGCDTIEIKHHAKLEARATELAEAYCAAYQPCHCETLATDALHPDPDHCVSEQKARLIAAFDQAEEDGLDFDPGCMSQLLSRYQELGCESFAAVQIELGNPALSENFGCALYHGDETDGICEVVPGTSWSDCAAGQECLDNKCTPVQELVAEGEDCLVNLSEYSYECASGLVCSNQSGTCVPFIGAGEPCQIGGVADKRCAPGSLLRADRRRPSRRHLSAIVGGR